MRKDVEQQLNYSVPILNLAFRQGVSVWDFSGSNPPGGQIDLNGKTFSYVDMCQLALECKRSGKYAEAIAGYVRVLSDCKISTGKIYISVMRSFIKVLFSINAFHYAFSIIGTTLADMQQASYVNQQEFQLFMGYFQDLIELSKMVIDKNDFSAIQGYAANYSGSNNYQLFTPLEEIKEDFRKIRLEVRQMYGE